MSTTVRIQRVRLTPASIGLILLTVVGAWLFSRVWAASGKVLFWMAIAVTVAGLLAPVVNWLDLRLPRGIAALIAVLTTMAALSGVVFFVVEDVRRELSALERTAPARAEQIEESRRFGPLAREVHLEQRVRTILEEAPQRLVGGSGITAVRRTTTRGLSVVVISVLTVFMILHGAKTFEAGASRFMTSARRSQIRKGWTRGMRYLRGSLITSLVAGLFALAIARGADVPGAGALALSVALWDAVPLIGFVLGAAPIVVLAYFANPAVGIALAVAFLAFQTAENLIWQKRVEARSLRPGPFLLVVLALGGYELGGIPSVLLALAGGVVLLAIADELLPPSDERTAPGEPRSHSAAS